MRGKKHHLLTIEMILNSFLIEAEQKSSPYLPKLKTCFTLTHANSKPHPFFYNRQERIGICFTYSKPIDDIGKENPLDKLKW